MIPSRTGLLSGIFHFFKQGLLALLVGLIAGSATAFFLWSLDEVTKLHWQHPWLLWLLPVGGFAVGLIYHYQGKGSDKGNNLILDEIHQSGGGVPSRMAPLVLIGTLTTHLFGGSAGREGTAVQMGGSLASLLARGFKLRHDQHRLILMCGMAAGFGAVFGTPLTGALFAMEVLVIGRLKYEAFIPVMIASLVGDLTCTAWGIRHTDYTLDTTTHAVFQLSLLAKAALSGVAFGWAARFFSELTQGIQRLIAKWVVYVPLRPAIGGCVILILVFVLGTRDYLGLGVDVPPGGQVSIVASFHEGGATPWSWFWKTLFTAVTCGSGFKGGEVTPLFFIGSTLGHALGVLLNEPVVLFAAFGFIAVFAGAANTPISCTVMGMELFGAQSGVYFAVVCFVAFYSSGHSGIYLSQRLARSQCTLREAREMKSKRQTL